MADNREKYHWDVWYAEWKAGLPEGSISEDRVERGYDAGQSSSSLVRQECARRASARADSEEEQCQEPPYPDEEPQQEEPEAAQAAEGVSDATSL